ncbi:MAG: hypothetical protein H7301_03575 [Cryobacterium sp.]|nr:hypothetical protein [Oligoflexia bacterium]
MNRLYRLSLSGLVAMSAWGCAPKEKQHESFLQVDAPFVDFVSNFEQVAAQESSPMVVNDLVVVFGSTPTLNETGVCEWAENETPRIIINQSIWNTLNDYDRQEVIFHELGHCLLRRVHQTSEIVGYNGASQVPESVMYPYRIPGSIYRDNMAHYNDELFLKAKRNQF